MDVKIEESWKKQISHLFETEYFQDVANFSKERYLSTTVYPKPKDIFRAFYETPFDKVKVVILGQDPYHNPNQAHGLCFSVPKGIKAPPSLSNIFKEICTELPDSASCVMPENERVDLTRWAGQGVFLLNSTLTVEKNKPASHSGKGWEEFTDGVIQTLSDKKENLVFMLWGNFAKSKSVLIDNNKHLVLTSAHPSPFSAHYGFFGNNHFKRANEYLMLNGFDPIDW